MKILYKSFLLFLTINVFLGSSVPISVVKKDLGNGWYNVDGYQNLYEYSEKEALQKAIYAAHQVALEKHSGIKLKVSQSYTVQEKDFEINRDDYLQISNYLSEGIITDSKLIKKEIVELESQRYLKVNIDVQIKKIKGEPDLNFKLEANLNRKIYNEGDPIIIDARTSKDSYLYVFNIAPDNTVSVLLPNKILKNNFVKKSTSIQIPTEKSGISYKAALLPSQQSYQEVIKVIAIKAEKLEDFDITLGKEKMTLDYFYKMLLELDRNQISEVDLFFTVVKKPE